MTKPSDIKPAKATTPKPAAKTGSGFHAGLTRPSDAGRTSAAMGGKGASSKKGR